MRCAHLTILASLLLACPAAHADLPRIFMSSTQGTGNLSSWPDAHGMTGLQGADEICRTAAARGNLEGPGDYIAYLSDESNDAYCRIHGLSGKRSAKCGQPWLPVGGGPWYRMDNLPALDRVEWAFPAAPAAGYMPRHVMFDETGTAVPLPGTTGSYAFDSTRADGSLSHFAPTCNSWTTSSASLSSELATGYHIFDDVAPYAWYCDRPARLMCLKHGPHGAAIQRRRAPSARMAFVSSVKGSGYFATWPAAGGTAGLAGADKVCQQLATSASLPQAASYKALLTISDGMGALNRFANDGPWYRTDGVLLAASKAALQAGPLGAPLHIDERQRPTVGFKHQVWTGSGPNATPVNDNCSDWTQLPNGETSARVGQTWTAGSFWSGEMTGFFCSSAEAAVYCFADNDSLFMSGME